jgi:hypothetical protein
MNLILNGGVVMNGDNGSGAGGDMLGGSVQAAAGTVSYFDFGGTAIGPNNFANRTLSLLSKVTGSGDLILVQGATVSATNLDVMSSSNTFSGRWIVRSGYLKGTGVGSLGTNSSFIVDPLATQTNSYAGGGFCAGPSVFEAGYDINSAGTLTLTNGGTMALHQNCAFTAVTINGTSLTNGTYSYSTLATMFPGVFGAGGSGAITVQTYTTNGPPSLAPQVELSSTWRFATDSTNIGMTNGWYATNFDDSAWQTLQSGASWESQGVAYAGYAWYRQRVFIPAMTNSQETPLTISLCSIYSDDDFYFNGVRIGGIKNEYKYNNLLVRTYTVPASGVLYGQTNTMAIRIWGGNICFQGKNSGLIAGTYAVELDPYRIMARAVGSDYTTEQPIELWDLSSAQQGNTFELVFRFPGSITNAGLAYTLKDFYGVTITNGTAPVAVSADGIARGVASVSATTSQAIYLAGRFMATVFVTNAINGALLYTNNWSLDYLSFSSRDALELPALTNEVDSTPYGQLTLIDSIDCSTPLTNQAHPYLQSAFGNHAQDYMTPGVQVSVPVNTILGRQAREPAYGWFAYRVGRGLLTPHKNYLLRIEYPEDKPRFCPIEIQAGHNYMDVGWKNGISSTDVYDNWPLSGTWQSYDTIVSLGDESVGTGGTGSASAQYGFWVYFMNKMNPGYYFSPYSGGPAIATIKLYAIDVTTNAPQITMPQGLPQRVLMLDWERQPVLQAADLVNYAKLMGYSAVSPVILKWAFANYGDPTNGYDSLNIDAADYWVTSPYVSGQPAQPAVPGEPSVHQQFLAATKNVGMNYIPRFEYGGSYNLPTSARAIGTNGNAAVPNRYDTWCANLLKSATFSDLNVLMDMLFKPYAASNPQLKGALWRIREDRMQTSYGPNDIAMFCADTGTNSPPGYSAAQLAAWASPAGPVGAAYSSWWQGKRAQFHQQLVTLLKSYRSDLTLYYYNWDEDKFAMMEPDLNSAAFYAQVSAHGGPTAYANDRAARASYTVSQYTNVLYTGNFTASLSYNRPDYALRPSLYTNITGIELFAPINWLCYAQSNYINYFQTADGLAVANCVSYDEIASREPNPKYEANMVLPGGGSFSMALELLSYYYGDARTLTYTSYTYGRGFADAHRRFAKAFLALPAVPGTLVTNTPQNVAAREYSTTNGIYIGIAYKGYTSNSLTINLPGTWNTNVVITNLVTRQVIPTVIVSSNLQISLQAGPMELDAFLVSGSTPGGQAPGNQAPTIASITMDSNRFVTLNFIGISNCTYQVQVATNLSPNVIWVPISTNIADMNGLWQFTDTQTTNYPQRFYRAYQQP